MRSHEEIIAAGQRCQNWDRISDPDLRQLAAATYSYAKAIQHHRDAVWECRSRGKSWDAIAAILGVSRQSASRQFGEPPDE